MATVYWNGNSQNISQVEKAEVTGVANNATLIATINGKTVTYTCTATDTTTTAATAWQALLANTANTPPEFQEITWSNPSAGIVLGTASLAGRSFTVAFTAGGGAAVTQTTPQANVSCSDVGDNNNWIRSGSPGIPQNGDDIVFANSSVPALYNLAALAAVTAQSISVYQTYTGTIGLPDWNPNGYVEYRPRYFKTSGASGLVVTVGIGTGNGPQRVRIDVGTAVATTFVVLNSGRALDTYAVYLLGAHASNTLLVEQTSCAMAVNPVETATIDTAVVCNGGTLALGYSLLSSVTVNTSVTVDGATAIINCGVPTITGNQARLTVTGAGYSTVTLTNSSSCTWLANSNISTQLTLQSSSFDKSRDTRPITIQATTMDTASTINDPFNAITYTTAIVMNGPITGGPVISGPGRTILIA